MKKPASIIKIMFLVVFAAAGIFLSINLTKINKAENMIETTINSEVSYFSDEFFAFSQYIKFKDKASNEYWAEKSNGRFIALYNISLPDDKLELNEAIDNIYSDIMKWDKAFFESDTFCQIVDGHDYLFYIHQLDDTGYKTGRFIVVDAPNGYTKSIFMHTTENKFSSTLGSCIGEQEAIDIAYSETVHTNLTLNKESDYLINTDFYAENEAWIWSIQIWNITQNAISEKSTSINQNEYFSCNIAASSGDVVSSGWHSIN